MSKRVIIICLLLCLVGFFFGWGLSGVVMAGFWGQPAGWWPVALGTGGFLCLPAGIGMLLGYRWGRTLAVVAFAVGYLICAAMLAAPVLHAGFINISINGHPAGYGMFAAISLMLLGILLLLHWTLYLPPFEEHLS